MEMTVYVPTRKFLLLAPNFHQCLSDQVFHHFSTSQILQPSFRHQSTLLQQLLIFSNTSLNLTLTKLTGFPVVQFFC